MSKSKSIYDHLNDLPEKIVTKYKLFSRRTKQYKEMISLRNKVAHKLSVLHKDSDQERFDYLSCLLFGVPIHSFSRLLSDIVNDRDLSEYDERQFIKI
jgi:hypothetical protein